MRITVTTEPHPIRRPGKFDHYVFETDMAPLRNQKSVSNQLWLVLHRAKMIEPKDPNAIFTSWWFDESTVKEVKVE